MSASTSRPTEVQLPAERRFAHELASLLAADRGDRPDGWRLTPRSVRSFVLGDRKLGVARKFYGDDALVDRCLVTLMSNRGLLLVGEPGTAKSMLSELLAAAISGSSTVTAQGTAGTTEDQLLYGWNYALLIAEGPSERALVPGPVLTAMRAGSLVRVEEITRMQAEVQDALIAILSDKHLSIPQLGDDGYVGARRGFNVIATANIRDRGVHEMSSALKRRFNFETVHPIRDPKLERELIDAQTVVLLTEAGLDVDTPRDVVDMLVAAFNELRSGVSQDGVVIDKPSAVLSTAEAVAVNYAACLDANYLGDGRTTGRQIGRQLIGTILKDNPDDAAKLRSYLDVVVKKRSGPWRDLWSVREELRSNS
ncbi:MAG: AAA family ATPase [Actinomycetota bacterium]|nr:AAA family ATPase [Actinomycetota bacterium]